MIPLRYGSRVTSPNSRAPTQVALDFIGQAIARLREPTGTRTTIGPPTYGPSVDNAYAYKTDEEFLEVRDDLIGAAFVIAQTYIAGKTWTPTMHNVNHVANYWKHRDDWDAAWSQGNRQQRTTMDEVKALGAAPPVHPGQVAALAQAVLGGPFGWDALWRAIQ
jgi:hypothetical protein